MSVINLKYYKIPKKSCINFDSPVRKFEGGCFMSSVQLWAEPGQPAADWRLGGMKFARYARSSAVCWGGVCCVSVETCHVTSQHSVPNICKHHSCVTPCGQMWRFLWQSNQLTSYYVSSRVKQWARVSVWRLFQALQGMLQMLSIQSFRMISRLPLKASLIHYIELQNRKMKCVPRKLPVCKLCKAQIFLSFGLFTNSETLVYFFVFAVQYLYCP